MAHPVWMRLSCLRNNLVDYGSVLFTTIGKLVDLYSPDAHGILAFIYFTAGDLELTKAAADQAVI